MRTPRQDYPANLFFHVHLASGICAALFALGVLAIILTRTPAPGQASCCRGSGPNAGLLCGATA